MTQTAESKSLASIKMFVTDYDGTLAACNGRVSKFNTDALKLLGKHNIVRVIATGRSLFSLSQVIDYDFPVDYLVFSSGAGVMQFDTGEIFFSHCFDSDSIEHIAYWLSQNNYNYMVHKPVPDNHYFYASPSGGGHPDFSRRISHYSQLGVELLINLPAAAAQFLVICDNHGDDYERIEAYFGEHKVIKTTSPFDGESLWVEIFPKGVSKATGIEFLCEKLNISNHETVVCGNDYNDLDMLEWSEHPFVTLNAPESLLSSFSNIPKNTDDGVAVLIKEILNKTIVATWQ
ncbi:MAG TPA: HAD family hydrolase [Bacteroidales bacterium]|nr:HAD family hydrolase [Bacteroidales bacterium]HQL69927.1 HAD family hydrolase [Bacteroidales bacterium]